jgi:cytochrome P450
MIPTVIIAEMLGVPEARYDDFRRWSHNITSNLGFGHESAETRELLLKTGTEINEYMYSEVRRRRAEKSDDFISTMLEMGLSDDEIVSNAILFLVAGYDTTAKAMSNCIVVLEQFPEQRAELADDPSLIPAAVEEVLRWWGVLQLMPRLSVVDQTLGGVEISRGDKVYSMLSAANRDPGRWPHPERFDIHRELKSHVAFGYGPHLCLGAPLARLEIKVALERLLALAPDYTLRDVDFANNFLNRGPERGVVHARPAAAVAHSE